MTSPLQSPDSCGESIGRNAAIDENIQDMASTPKSNDLHGESDESTAVVAQDKQDIASPPQSNDSHGASHHSATAAAEDKQGLETGIGLENFHLFPKLATELRLRIWKFAAQQHSLDLEFNQLSVLEVVSVPPLLHICRESREEGLKLYLLSPVIDDDDRQLLQKQMLAISHDPVRPGFDRTYYFEPGNIIFFNPSSSSIDLGPGDRTVPMYFCLGGFRRSTVGKEAMEFCHLMFKKWIEKVFPGRDLILLSGIVIYFVKDTAWTTSTLPRIRVIRLPKLGRYNIELKLDWDTYKHWFDFQASEDKQTATEQPTEPAQT